MLDDDHRIYFGEISGITRYVSRESDAFNLHNMSLSVNEVRVVGERKTGYGDALGEVSTESWDTGTVTHDELAQKVGAIWDALKQHGLIGD